MGEYRVNMLAMVRCESIKTNGLIQINYYLSKTSSNTTEIKGNVTYYIPLDDTFNIELNLAVKDSIGGWKENAHIFKTPKACSSLKHILGNSWSTLTERLGMSNVRGCPIPVGCYVAKNMPHDHWLYNLPRQFFYGTYKLRFQYTKNKEIYGCSTSIIEVKRLWEND
ncbi:uncharacterized protein LOC111041073 [Myzus persicae]|uniref:uncharacterized protein LOC111041073 n=1 Tax=Myzus persicae TaxID=13164 RepID=UPI000B93658B|nr:uncharacterized protein LOC111041073 [Myzus persicae]